MSAIDAATSTFLPSVSAADDFRADVLAGLSEIPKRISSKHLYDKRGSELFDQICELEEYYVTRCELEIMRRHAHEMAGQLGGPVNLVEFGSGSSLKTRLLLDQLDQSSTYLPVDVSREHLEESCAALRSEYPDLEVQPLYGDFTRPLQLPDCAGDKPTVVYFPGSTIGNFEERAAVQLLQNIQDLCGKDGQALIGVDLQKEAAVVHAAYNDHKGVTAEFTKNLLRRINRELGGDFDLQGFDYHARYNSRRGRIEAALVSRRDQRVVVDDQLFDFGRGEAIHTEYSHKYTIPQFAAMAERAGFELCRQWNDNRRYFAVLLLRAAG